MIKSVLCAVDVSQPEVDGSVLKAAAKLAALDNAQLDVITVVPDFGMSVVGTFFEADFHEQAEEHAREALGEFVEATLGSEANKKIRHIVTNGRAYEKILSAAKEANTDLIVIGSHKPEISDYFIGPNAARVVRHASCSVYVVRD